MRYMGIEAMGMLTQIDWNGRRPTSITQTSGGIDVDNAGRSYSNESEVDVSDVYWTAILYVPDVVAGQAFFACELDGENRMLWFYITDDDAESHGTTFTMNYEGE